MTQINPTLEPQDRGNVVVAVTYLFIAVTVLFTTLRILITTVRKRRFGVDDVFLALALIAGFLSAVCTATSVMNGLGRSVITVHSNQLARYFKLSYASHMFMVVAMAASKHSTIALIQRITSVASPARRYLNLFHIATACWGVFAVLGLAFQCGFPAPWIYSPTRCSGHGAVWYPIVISSMLIDVVLAFGYMPVTRDAQINQTKKNTIAVLFLSRLSVPVLAIAYMATLAPALNSDNQTAAQTVPSILAQIMMDLSIVAAALPALSRFVSALESVSTATTVSEIGAVSLDPSHSRGTSDQNNKLRDWAFAQLRNSPTPNSLMKDISVEVNETPRKPDDIHVKLERVDPAPPIPPRSVRRSGSPQFMLNLTFDSPSLDVREAWFVDSKRTSAMTDDTTHEMRRISQKI